jgi:hypothetical protein
MNYPAPRGGVSFRIMRQRMFHRVCAPLIVSLTNPNYPTYRPALKVPRLKRRG